MDSRIPQIYPMGSVSFSTTDTNKNINLVTGVGYLAVVLDVRTSTDNHILPVTSAYATEDFKFDFRKDGVTVVQYYQHDVLYASSILGNISNGLDLKADGLVNSSFLLPLAPTFLAPADLMESVCHSTIDSQSFSLNIKKKAGVALSITAYGITIPTTKAVNKKYLYTERVNGIMNQTITGFSTRESSYIYGYTFNIAGAIEPQFQYSLNIRTQTQDIFKFTPVNLLAACNISMGSSFVANSTPDGTGLVAAVRLNAGKRYDYGIPTMKIDDTQFRITSPTTATAASAPIYITHYQMRDI